jgi:hypothetical protein
MFILLRQYEDSRCLAPSATVRISLVDKSGFYCIPAKTPGIGLLGLPEVLKRLLAIESDGFPQKTPLPFMLTYIENLARSPSVIFLAGAYRIT